MSYNYSEMNDIIAKQYAKKTGSSDNNNNNWFLEESIKFGKGYSNPGEYMQSIAKNVIERSNKLNNINKTSDTALYIDENR